MWYKAWKELYRVSSSSTFRYKLNIKTDFYIIYTSESLSKYNAIELEINISY